MYSIKKAAEILNTTPATVRRWIKQLDVKTVRMSSGVTYLPVSSVEEIKKAREASPRATQTSAGMHRYWIERTAA